MAARPIAWAAAFALVALAPTSAILTSRGSLVLRDVDASQTSRDLTWLGSVAAILSVLSWIPRSAGLRDCLGRGRNWAETALLVVMAGVLGAGLSQLSALLGPASGPGQRLPEHVAIVLQVGGLAMLASSLPVLHRAPVWALLGLLVGAEALPRGLIGNALTTVTAGDPSDASTWILVAGLWIASLPRTTDSSVQAASGEAPVVSG